MLNRHEAPLSGQSTFRRLVTYSLPHKARFLAAFVMLGIAIAAEMAIPWLVKTILDEVIVPQQFDWVHLGLLSGLVLGFYVIQAVFQYFQALTFRHGALLVVNDVRKELFEHVLNFPIRTFDKLPSGKLVSYITNDTESLRDMFVSTMPTIIQGSLRITGIFIAIALLDWRLMLLSLALIPVLLLTMHWYRKVSMPIFDGIRGQISNINNNISESLQGMALIQAFQQEKAFQDKFERNNNSWFKFRTRSIAIDSLMLAPFTRLVGSVTAIGIVAWFASASLSTAVEIGTLYAFLNYIERFFDPFRQLSMELRKLQVATVSSKRIFELLDDKEGQHAQPSAFADLTCQKDIEFRNVSLTYDEGHKALSEVSFKAEGGKFTAIVGHSGSGKSSVINLLMRFYQHQQGEILVGGKPIQAMPDAQLRRLFGLVSQDPYIFSGSILENIDLSHRNADKAKVKVAAEQVKAAKFIERLSDGYDHQPGYGGSSLSTGERQLLALARALAHDPQIFLLDEATANIDSETEEAVKAALANIQRGRTVIAVAHRLSTVQNADQILVMSKGKVVQSGIHDELVSQPGDYRELYLAQKTKEENAHENINLGLAAASAA
ncbi:ABC transporter ATP-binding protein [Photobacterium sanctipauli]|uniref:ABC transporter ATP-binding protein n=1 Tax=Photobacterium sanctipauli TaxID=1342794 RepID=A0A2T3NW09_9GAMM|nr:ABC transporter ATP-binding protein [Photobacterium sanctipauli]PSW20474.1 ABC transporter ATP-binding protein [Photobacterium sanctipauli]